MYAAEEICSSRERRIGWWEEHFLDFQRSGKTPQNK
jgi:hypothetical protein